MKIRTDFVTNSSSGTSAEIMIDNQVLLEILQRYKDMGVFGDVDTRFSIGSYQTFFEEYRGSYKPETKAPAFYLFESFHGEGGGAIVSDLPDSLDKVLTEIIGIMSRDPTTFLDCRDDGGKYDEELYEQLKKELQQRKEEVKAGYIKIMWRFNADECYIERGDECEWKYTYDPENGEAVETLRYADYDYDGEPLFDEEEEDNEEDEDES